MLKVVLVVLLLVVCCVLFVGIERAESQQAAAPWELHEFNSKILALNYLNTLPVETANTAKVFAIPSERNVLGWLGSPYQVMHRGVK